MVLVRASPLRVHSNPRVCRLSDYDARTGMATLALHEHSVRIDTSLIPHDTAFRVESFYQVLGELETRHGGAGNDDDTSTSTLVLRARVAMNVDGIDVPLYERALELRREYEVERGMVMAAGNAGAVMHPSHSILQPRAIVAPEG